MLYLRRFASFRKSLMLVNKARMHTINKNKYRFGVGRSFINTNYSLFSGYRKWFLFWTDNSKPKVDANIFEEVSKEDETLKDQHIKRVSLRLINTNNSDQVLSIFEFDYLKSARKDIAGEELWLLLYYAVKHMGNISQDMRLTTLLDMLYNRFEGMQFDFILTTIWSLGILVSIRGADIPIENKMKIIRELLKCEIPRQSVQNLPSLVFSISTLIGSEHTNDEVVEIVKRITNFYFKEGILTLDPLQASTLLTGFSRLQYHNSEYLLTLAKSMKKDNFFYDWVERDLMSIIVALTDLHYKDEDLFKILHKHVWACLDNISPYSLFIIIQSYARIIPEKHQCYFDFYHKLLEVLEKHPDELDVELYVNQFLSLACYKGKINDGRVNRLLKAYVQVMDKQTRFSFYDFTGSDASNLLVAVVSLDYQSTKFIKRIVDVITLNMSLLTNLDLINLSKSVFSLKSEDFPGLYQKIHSQWVQRLTSFQPWERKILEETYTSQGLIKDSPFVKNIPSSS